jgi:hypothetical protein
MNLVMECNAINGAMRDKNCKLQDLQVGPSQEDEHLVYQIFDIARINIFSRRSYLPRLCNRISSTHAGARKNYSNLERIG